MKKLGIFIVFLLLMQTLSAQTYFNKIGLDFFGGYIVNTPKKDLPGNRYNTLMNSTSGMFGIYYERFLNNPAFSLKTGAYFNYQFKALGSISIPVEFNGDVFGKRSKTVLFAGYTAGLCLNDVFYNSGGSRFFYDNVIYYEMTIKKHFYIAPYVGINAGINFHRFGFTTNVLFNFFVPEFVNYKTVYKDDQGKEITEYNTNDNWGITLRFGLAYRF